MEKIITITASHRPPYTQRVIDSLALCHGVSSYKLVAFVEPISQHVINIFKKISFCDVELHVNDARLGHTLNAHKSLSRGFELSDYVIRIEDDTLLAKDFLKFHEFCSEKFKNEKDSIFSISAGHYHEAGRTYRPEELSSFTTRAGFSNQGWGTWSDRWLEKNGAAEIWEFPETIFGSYYNVNYRYGGWDALMENTHRKDRNEIIPIISRVKNIGILNGVHSITPEEHKERIEVADWAYNYELPDTIEYNEYSTDNLQQI
jgi:hypothetical protein